MSDTLPIETDCRTVHAQLKTHQQLKSHGQSPAGEFLLLDVREPDEFSLVKIPGATLIPMSELAQRVAELEPYRHALITVHCHHGGRSLRVANWLRQQGFAKAQSMAGGIDQWAQEIDTSLPRY